MKRAKITGTLRLRLVIFASIAYVIASAAYANGRVSLRVCGVSVVAFALGYWASRRDPARRIAVWGAAIVVASLGTPFAGWIDLLGGLGAAACALSMPIVMTFTDDDAGFARQIARRTDARGQGETALLTFAIAMMWGFALTSAGLSAANSHLGLAGDVRGWAIAAPLVTGLSIAASAGWTCFTRRLELAASTRGRAVLASVLGVSAIVIAAAFADFASLTRAARLGVAIVSLLVGGVARSADVVRIERVLRRSVALAMIGGPVVFLGVAMVEGGSRNSGLILAIFGAIAMAIGACVRFLEEPFRPAQGALLDAVAKAMHALMRSSAEDAPRETLIQLRALGRATAASPELWTFAPARVLRVDAAGYPRGKEEELPKSLLEMASQEPYATLRTDVLDALEVRRADLRPLARWMNDRGAMTATVVTRAGEVEGLLVVPLASRRDPLTAEEARALKELADALASICATKSALTRALDRDRDLRLRAEDADEVAARLRHDAALDVGRNELAASRLARPATVGMYSAVSSFALDAIDRRVRAEAPIAIVAPSGVDPVPFLARAHLQSPRHEAALVLVDGTSSREHDPSRWSAPLTSPLALAHHGRLVLLDGAALPHEVQRIIARALAERRPPWERAEPIDIALVFTAIASPSLLLERGHLDAQLAARLGDACDAPIVLPRLRDRPEDIRAILIDRLAREGLRVRGNPVGIEDAAFARIIEHTFPGEDTELATLVQRLVAECSSDVVTLRDLNAIAFVPLMDVVDEEKPRLRGL